MLAERAGDVVELAAVNGDVLAIGSVDQGTARPFVACFVGIGQLTGVIGPARVDLYALTAVVAVVFMTFKTTETCEGASGNGAVFNPDEFEMMRAIHVFKRNARNADVLRVIEANQIARIRSGSNITTVDCGRAVSFDGDVVGQIVSANIFPARIANAILFKLAGNGTWQTAMVVNKTGIQVRIGANKRHAVFQDELGVRIHLKAALDFVSALFHHDNRVLTCRGVLSLLQLSPNVITAFGGPVIIEAFLRYLILFRIGRYGFEERLHA